MLLDHVLAGVAHDESPLRHVVHQSARAAQPAPWPAWAQPETIDFWRDEGISSPYTHQVRAADHAHTGQHVVVATGTASGKSLAYQLPIAAALAADPLAKALYLAPTKALANDQLASAVELCAAVPTLRTVSPATFDGDTELSSRRWIRENSRWLFTNPDMAHLSLLAGHSRWAHFLRGLRYIVVDECHYYRGVFGANVALVLRRLLRLARRHGADPVVILASATTAEPDRAASALVGEPVIAVTDDGSPRGERTIALWEPPLLRDVTGEHGAPVRRSAATESARLLADLVVEGARTLAFVASRRGAERISQTAKRYVELVDPQLVPKIAAYRAGYLPEDRRALERALSSGELTAAATTNALELGIDIAGLDAVLISGFPGTVASFWQQGGRAGRRGGGALVVLIARDDPLDTYVVHHPAALLDRPVESSVVDVTNPHVLSGHLLCAASELPLTRAEVDALDAAGVIEHLVSQGYLRQRGDRWFIAPDVHPHEHVDIRGSGAAQVSIVESETGRLLGTVDGGRAPATVHPGAVYLHQGESYLVDELYLDDALALVHAAQPDYSTFARETTDITIDSVNAQRDLGSVTVAFVNVAVSHHVIGFLRQRSTGEVIDYTELEMPQHTLHTTAALYTITPEALLAAGLEPPRWPGALHAAEHAAIGLLPLIAGCDRWDIGGVSTALSADTGLPSVFVYDGYDGGAGFAERGYERMRLWLKATRDAISDCECDSGCPSCVQSPKCGNGNEPLDKSGAIVVLDLVLRELL